MYDNNGNIVKKREFAKVSLKEGLLLEEEDSKDTAYVYEGDRLVSYGGADFVYDVMGNPTTYRNMSCVWEKGKQLKSISDGANTVSFTYDEFGMRTTKTAGGITTNYVYENGKLLREVTGSEKIDFVYGSDGIIGFRIGNKNYLYRKNVFGDVTEIYSDNGTLVGKYSYTAFGECIVKVNEGGIAEKNPIRYRGYYYDEEMSLYYLKSRYYDPVTGRFITIDDISYIDPETINGLNLYAYCLNNPVMYVDPTGHAPWWSWFVFGLQVLGGIALCFVPGAQGIGVSLIVGGGLGLISNAVSPAIGQAIGGASSIANGWGAFSTGMSILGLGIPGLIGGIALMLVGGATMVFGANEIVSAATGTNYIQQWTGMSDTAYGWTYFGLNLASSVGQIVGTRYRQIKTRTTIYNTDGSVKQYRYYRSNGNKLYDIDFNHPAYGNPNIKFPHYHGWTRAGIRAKDHQSYIELLIWLLFGGK